MDDGEAIERVLLGEPLSAIAAAYREERLRGIGLDPREALPATFAHETRELMIRVCRELGERCEGDRRAFAALHDYVREADFYAAWDALLTHFEFDGKEALIRRGRELFAGPMTAHWRS